MLTEGTDLSISRIHDIPSLSPSGELHRPTSSLPVGLLLQNIYEELSSHETIVLEYEQDLKLKLSNVRRGLAPRVWRKSYGVSPGHCNQTACWSLLRRGQSPDEPHWLRRLDGRPRPKPPSSWPEGPRSTSNGVRWASYSQISLPHTSFMCLVGRWSGMVCIFGCMLN
jgi:hypothetical protein